VNEPKFDLASNAELQRGLVLLSHCPRRTRGFILGQLDYVALPRCLRRIAHALHRGAKVLNGALRRGLGHLSCRWRLADPLTAAPLIPDAVEPHPLFHGRERIEKLAISWRPYLNLYRHVGLEGDAGRGMRPNLPIIRPADAEADARGFQSVSPTLSGAINLAIS
jgi:hypothetical protein